MAARSRRATRRWEPSAGLVIDSERHAAALNGQALDLTPLEIRLLGAFAATPGRVFSRDQLLDKLHDDQRALSDCTIDSHVKNLRRKLEPDPRQPRYVLTVYGVGYRFADDRDDAG